MTSCSWFLAALGLCFFTAPVAAAEVDSYGDPLPPGALVRLGSTRLYHPGGVHCVALAPDGKIVLSAGHDHTLRLWDVGSGRELPQFQVHDAHAAAAVFSPDGNTILSVAAIGKISVWSTASGKLLRSFGTAQTLGGQPAAIAIPLLSPDGQTLYSRGQDGVIRQWDVASGKELRQWPTPRPYPAPLALSGDGKFLAYGPSDGTIRLWDTGTNKEIAALPRQGNSLASSLAFSPDGKTLASGTDAVTLWDVQTGKEIAALGGGPVRINGLVFSPTGQTLILLRGMTISVLGLASVKELRQYLLPNVAQTISLSADGKTLAAAGVDGKILLWDLAENKELHAGFGRPSLLQAVALTPDGKTAFTSDTAGTFRVWDAVTGKERAPLKNPNLGHGAGQLWSVAPDGKTLIHLDFDRNLHFWDLENSKETQRFYAVLSRVGSAVEVLAADGRILASAAPDGTIRVLDVQTGKEQPSLTGEPSKLAWRLSLAPDGSLLAAWLGKQVRVWDLGFPGAPLSFDDFTRVASIAIAPDARTFACVDADVQVREAATGLIRLRFPKPPQVTELINFSPDGWLLVLGGGSYNLLVYDAVTGKELKKLTGHQAWISGLAFTVDGKRLASSSHDGTVLIWDLASMAGHEAPLPKPLEPAALARLWEELAAADGGKAHQAIGTLVRSPGPVEAFFKAHLRPGVAIGPKEIAKWILDLDAEDFAVREKASQRLEGVRNLAEPALRKALANKPSVEVERRINALLEKKGPGFDPDRVRDTRALEVLERLGTPEARQVLETVAQGPADALETIDARRALERLARRPPSPP